jgi:hypothetical protein
MKPAPAARVLLVAILTGTLHIASTGAAPPEELRGLVSKRVEAEYPSLFGIYKKLHAQPELFFMEVKTAALVAVNCARSASRSRRASARPAWSVS